MLSIRNPRGLIISSVAQAPYIRGDIRELLGCQLRASFGRHGTAVFLRVWDPFFNRLPDAVIAAVAPQPLLLGQIWTQGRSSAIGAVTACARRSADLAMIDAIS